MQWLWDQDGKRYLDMFAGIVTVSVGHCHPRVTAALEKQIHRYINKNSLRSRLICKAKGTGHGCMLCRETHVKAERTLKKHISSGRVCSKRNRTEDGQHGSLILTHSISRSLQLEGYVLHW
jgi:hypothetical protein